MRVHELNVRAHRLDLERAGKKLRGRWNKRLDGGYCNTRIERTTRSLQRNGKMAHTNTTEAVFQTLADQAMALCMCALSSSSLSSSSSQS